MSTLDFEEKYKSEDLNGFEDKLLEMELRLLEIKEKERLEIQERIKQEDSSRNTIDIDLQFWESIKDAAEKSNWIPEDYYINDWVADVIRFLKGEE